MPSVAMHAMNSTTIKIYEQISLFFNLNLREFRWTFVAVDLPYPILRIDFLNHFNLLVDVRRQKLVDAYTSLATPGRVSADTVYSPPFFTVAVGNQIHGLLASFSELVNPTFKTVQVKHTNTHISTHGPHVFSQPRRLVADRFTFSPLKPEYMLQLGLIQSSTSPWASLHLAQICDNHRPDFRL